MDREEFGQLIIDNTDSLYRISKAILKNDTECEDAVQEAVVCGFANLYQLKKKRYAKTWLIRILINECYKILNHNKKIQTVDGTFEQNVSAVEICASAEEVYFRDDYSELYYAMQHLTEEQRLAIVLHYMEGYSVMEIARITKVSLGTVKSRLARGRNKLKEILKEVEYDYVG